MTLESRVRNYLAKIDGAVSGEGGHNQTFKVACILVHGFDLDIYQAFPFLEAWNQKCQPPWTTHELMHKLADAVKQTSRCPTKERGHLLKTIYSGHAKIVTEVEMEQTDWDHPYHTAKENHLHR